MAFVSQASLPKVATYGLDKHVVAIKGCRSLKKSDMRWNDALPKVHVDPETFIVHANGEKLTTEPADEVPLARATGLF